MQTPKKKKDSDDYQQRRGRKNKPPRSFRSNASARNASSSDDEDYHWVVENNKLASARSKGKRMKKVAGSGSDKHRNGGSQFDNGFAVSPRHRSGGKEMMEMEGFRNSFEDDIENAVNQQVNNNHN